MNSISYAVVEDVKLFLSNYAEENAISLPSRIPGYKDEDNSCPPTKPRSVFGALLKSHAKE